ncbi:MAG: hypothetical protein WKF92_07135 [Pyrinomonadaceae bacterium]
MSTHVFNSIECECREEMEISQRLIEEEGKRVIIWLDQTARETGILL